jgi:hypothetical protein
VSNCSLLFCSCAFSSSHFACRAIFSHSAVLRFLQGHSILVPKPGWLALFLPELVEGELRLCQRFGGVELAHLPFLVFLLTEAQWRLCGWIVVPVAPLGAHP